MCEHCKHRWAQEAGVVPKDIFYYMEEGAKVLMFLFFAALIVITSPAWAPFAILGFVVDNFAQNFTKSRNII
jgi:hypothetical protein